MGRRVVDFIKKQDIGIRDVVFIKAEDKKVYLHLRDGRMVHAFIPLKEFYEVFRPYGFVKIRRNMVINREDIGRSCGGSFQMKDGTDLEGSRDFHFAEMEEELAGEKTHEQHLMERKGEILTATQRMKDPFVMFELLPAGGMERTRRARIVSANNAMKELAGLSFTEMMAYRMQIYMPDIGTAWFPVIEGVALNGKPRMIPGTAQKDGQERDYIILCVQPVSGYCACFLLPADRAWEAGVPALPVKNRTGGKKDEDLSGG